MSQVMKYAFRLFGPRKDQTVSINGHPFVNGFYNAIVGSEAAGTLMNVLKYYGAYAHGTPEYYAALEKEEAENGRGDLSESTGSRPATEVPNEFRSNGAEPSKAAAVAGVGDAGRAAGSAGTDPTGDGHGHAGVPEFAEAASQPEPVEPDSIGSEDLRTAVMKLDPETDTHWVMTGAHKGMPKLQAVEDAYGRSGVTRQDVDAAIPNWSRDRALEVALET